MYWQIISSCYCIFPMTKNYTFSSLQSAFLYQLKLHSQHKYTIGTWIIVPALLLYIIVWVACTCISNSRWCAHVALVQMLDTGVAWSSTDSYLKMEWTLLSWIMTICISNAKTTDGQQNTYPSAMRLLLVSTSLRILSYIRILFYVHT